MSEPDTLEIWLAYVRQYEADIFVREQINGKWEAVSLASLSPERWAYWVARWLKEHVMPVRVLRGESHD